MASRAVLLEFRRWGISTALMLAALAGEEESLYLRCNEGWARCYEQFGFRCVEPSELPADLRKDYRIGTIIVALRLLRRAQTAPHPHETRRIPNQRDRNEERRQEMYGTIEYLIALSEVEKARRASQERKGHRKEGFSDREPTVCDARVQTNSKEVAKCQ